jgi:hypothetical protein
MFAQYLADQQKFTFTAYPRRETQQTLERNLSGFYVDLEYSGVQFDCYCFLHGLFYVELLRGLLAEKCGELNQEMQHGSFKINE